MSIWTLLACTAGTLTIESDTADSGARDSADTGEDTGDTGHTGDTGEAPTLRVEGTLTLDGGALDGEGTAALVHVVLGDGLFFDDVVAQAPMGALGQQTDWAIELPAAEPDDDYFQDTGDGFELALFVTGVYVDIDGDGEPGEKDRFVGGSLRMLGWIRGDVPPQFGVSEGWIVLALDFSSEGGVEELYGVDEVADGFDFGGVLLPRFHNQALPVAADFERDQDLLVDLVAVAPIIEQGVVPSEPTVSSAALAVGDASIELPGPYRGVPPDHLITDPVEAPGLAYGFYAALAYEDADGNGAWSPGVEEPVANSMGAGVLALHARAIGFDALIYTEAYGWPMGWFLLDTSDDGGLLDWSEGLSLSVEEP